MDSESNLNEITRRALVRGAGRTLTAGAALASLVETAPAAAQAPSPSPQFQVDAGVDRVVVLPGKTYLRGWVGKGRSPSATRPLNGIKAEPPTPLGPDNGLSVRWRKASGPGTVRFAEPASLTTTATFTAPGRYVLELAAEAPGGKAASTLAVQVEPPAPAEALRAVEVSEFEITSPFWKSRLRPLILNWIPHCIRMINRTDLPTGDGGIDNFIEAGKKLRGQPHGHHKGFVFSNAWVYQTIESISLALGCDLGADPEIETARQSMRATLDEWIPIILAAQEPDGYLQTAFTLPRRARDGRIIDAPSFKHWDPAHRPDHEGYVAGYFLEAAMVHHRMTGGQDDRLYQAARRLADCWERNIGPPPKQAWFDEHQSMEQALMRFGRYVDSLEGRGAGRKYIQLAKFLLDCRYTTSTGPRDRNEYSQSHLPVIEQYEAVGHAVRAAYQYSAMADVVMENGDADYRSAVRSLWANITHRKLYVTGGIGTGETSEGFGPDYSLPNHGYLETCASCGELFFQWKAGLIWHDARMASLFEDTLYNTLAGSLDLSCRHFYYDNPLDERVARYQWHLCPCCVGNVPRTLLMLPTWMYARSRDAIYVNLFAGSRVRIDEVARTSVEMVQETDYPWRGDVTVTVNPAAPVRFRLHIRIPDRNVSALYQAAPAPAVSPGLRVNGTTVKALARNGYAVIDRTWKPGDRVEFQVPLAPQRVHASAQAAALRGKVALRYGPLLYNIEHQDQDIAKALPASAPIEAEWKEDLLGGVMVLRSHFVDGSPLLAIPNFARMNRQPGTDLPPPQPPRRADRTPPQPPKSIVWIKEA